MPQQKPVDSDLKIRLQLLEDTVEAAKAEFGSQHERVADALDAYADLLNTASDKRLEAIAAREKSQAIRYLHRFAKHGQSHAGFWLRFAARAIDSIVIGTVASIAMIIATVAISQLGPGVATNNTGHFYYILSITSVLSTEWLYYAGFESSCLQASPGKLMLGLKVTTKDGGRMGFARALIRSLAKLPCTIPPLYAGLMMAGWTRRKQALHDMICDTLVVRISR
ncbi:MAG: RDD family protein [Candidatus Obscuribacterales bacterium]|nr:RDD family protein [Candidatus Obscuribacterales bacterium]